MEKEPKTKYKLPPGFVKLQLVLSADLLEAINSAATKDLRTQRAFVTKILQEHPSVREFIPKVACVANTEVVPPPVCQLGFLPDGSVDRGYPDHLLPPEAIAARAAAGWPPVKPN